MDDRKGMTMEHCDECGGSLATSTIPVYRDALLGLPSIVVLGAVEETRCANCGEVDVTIPNLGGLIAAAAVTRVKDAAKFSGKEIRFLRKALEQTAKEFAHSLQVTDSTVSRWETEKEPIGPQSEKLLRLLVGTLLKDKAPLIDFDPDEIARMELRVRPAGPPAEVTFEAGCHEEGQLVDGAYRVTPRKAA